MAHPNIRRLPIQHHGHPVVEFTYHGNFTREMIERKIEKLTRQFRSSKEFQAVLPYPGGWRSGQWFAANEPISLFTLLDYYDGTEVGDCPDPEYFDEFRVYVRNAPPQAGGCDAGLNDCLWESFHRNYGT